MGERAKIIVNEYSALELLKRKDLDLDKFYSSDLKIFINAAKQEIERLNNIINNSLELLETRFGKSWFVFHDELKATLEGKKIK
jgi:hypothetical protein